MTNKEVRNRCREILALCHELIKLETSMAASRFVSEADRLLLENLKGKIIKEGLTIDQARKLGAGQVAKQYLGR